MRCCSCDWISQSRRINPLSPGQAQNARPQMLEDAALLLGIARRSTLAPGFVPVIVVSALGEMSAQDSRPLVGTACLMMCWRRSQPSRAADVIWNSGERPTSPAGRTSQCSQAWPALARQPMSCQAIQQLARKSGAWIRGRGDAPLRSVGMVVQGNEAASELSSSARRAAL